MNKPKIRQYFPKRFPVGAYSKEPRVIIKDPNGIEINISTKTDNICSNISFSIYFITY